MFNKTLLLIAISCLALPGYAVKNQCGEITGLTALRYWDSPAAPYAELERYKRKPRVASVDGRTVRSHQIQTQVLGNQAKQSELSPKQSSATSKKRKKTVSGASMRHEAALPAASGSAEKGEQKTERTQPTAKQAPTPSIAAIPALLVQTKSKATNPAVEKKPVIEEEAVAVKPLKAESEWKTLQITAIADQIPEAGNNWYPKAMQITIDEAIRSHQ